MKSFSLGSNPSGVTLWEKDINYFSPFFILKTVIMKQCAVVLNGNDVIQVSNLKRKYNKIITNPNMKILEECNSENLEDKFLYWKNILEKPETENIIPELRYTFKNKNTGEIIVSIYDTLDNLKHIINIEEYERCL